MTDLIKSLEDAATRVIAPAPAVTVARRLILEDPSDRHP